MSTLHVTKKAQGLGRGNAPTGAFSGGIPEHFILTIRGKATEQLAISDATAEAYLLFLRSLQVFVESVPGIESIDVRLSPKTDEQQHALQFNGSDVAKLSRYQIAGRMSEALNRDITKFQLDSFSAESKEHHRFPLEYLPAFTRATGDSALVRLVASRCNGQFVETEDSLRLELGRIADAEQELRARKKMVATLLEGRRGS